MQAIPNINYTISRSRYFLCTHNLNINPKSLEGRPCRLFAATETKQLVEFVYISK